MEQHELSLFFIRSNARCAQHQFIVVVVVVMVVVVMVVPTYEIKHRIHKY